MVQNLTKLHLRLFPPCSAEQALTHCGIGHRRSLTTLHGKVAWRCSIVLQKRLELYFQDIYEYGRLETYPEHAISTSNMLSGSPTLSGGPLGLRISEIDVR